MIEKYFPLYAFIFFFTLIVTAIIEKQLLKVLSGRASQPIYEGGPSWHIKKSGTPTMGGLAFLTSILLAVFISSFFLYSDGKTTEALSIIILGLYSALNALIGVIDDLKKLRKKENAGLTPKQKLLLQFILAALFLFARAKLFSDGTEIVFSFGKIDLGLFYYPLTMLLLLGIVNCANLSDGIDGLASGIAFSIGAALFYLSAYLYSEVALIAASLMGGAVGFLFFNIHPAKIFMGDTGSLFLGALTVSAAFSLGNPFLIIFLGGVYVIEGVSVILQVVWFKSTGKRLFKMAPLHHHFEKNGMSETKICMIAMIATILMSIPAFILYIP